MNGKEVPAPRRVIWKDVRDSSVDMRTHKPARRKRATPPPGLLRIPPEWAWHYRTLVALRDHLVEEQRSPGAVDDFDRVFIRALLTREPDALGEINAAIERILHGNYGFCEKTGRPLTAARLRAAPWARCT